MRTETSSPSSIRSTTRSTTFWKIGDGRLYLNLNGDIQAESSKDIAGNIAKADSNWQRIRTVAADRL
jgi:hypothetical protein